MRERIAKLAALVDGARSFGRDVGRDAAGEGELLEELLHTLLVAGDVGVDLLIAAVEPVLRDHGVAAVARTGDVDHIEVVFLYNAVEVSVNEVLAGNGAPVADDLFLDALLGERLLKKRIIQQIELAGGQVVRGAPIGVHGGELLLGCRGGFSFVHYCTSLKNCGKRCAEGKSFHIIFRQPTAIIHSRPRPT